MTPSKIYSFTVPGFGAYTLPVVGAYFVLLASTGPVQVVGDSFGNIGSLVAGQGIDGASFNSLQFVDVTGANNNVQVMIAGQDFVNQRVVGEVSVIDGSKSTVIADAAFMFATQVNANAAGVSSAALLNPAASGKRAIIKSLSFAPVAAPNVVRTGQYNSAQAWGAGASGFSKRIPAGASAPAASACKVDTKNTFAANAPITNVYESFLFATAQSQIRTFDRPVVIEPGGGYAIDLTVVNVSLLFALEWTEELVT